MAASKRAPRTAKPTAPKPAAVTYTPYAMPVAEDFSTFTPEQKLAKAREMVFFKYPFLGYLVGTVDSTIIPPGHPDEAQITTAATDGRRILWNRQFLEELGLKSTMFTLGHEVLHCALQHVWRRYNRDPELWNQAIDAVTNEMLKADGLEFTPPPSWLATGGAIVEMPGANMKSAEEVYDEMLKGEKKPRTGSAPNRGGTLDNHDFHSGQPNQDGASGAVSESWKRALRDAAGYLGQSKSAFRDGILLRIGDLLKPKIDWRQLLTNGLTWPNDYEWIAPYDRRQPGFFQPSLTGHHHRVIVAVDTSGSTTGEKLQEFWAEMVGLLQMNNIEAVVLLADDTIKAEILVEQFDPAMFETARGGGGTDFVPVFERAKSLAEEGWIPERLIYLTDLDGTFPDADSVAIPTIWVVSEGDEKPVPFGDVIPLTD